MSPHLDYTGEFKDVHIVSRGDRLVIVVEEEPSYAGTAVFGLGYDTGLGVVGSGTVNIADPFAPEMTISGEIGSPRVWGGQRGIQPSSDGIRVQQHQQKQAAIGGQRRSARGAPRPQPRPEGKKRMLRAVTPAFHPAEAGVWWKNWRGCADGAMGDWRSASVTRSRSPIAASWAA